VTDAVDEKIITRREATSCQDRPAERLRIGFNKALSEILQRLT
jgi:hypothetical protein